MSNSFAMMVGAHFSAHGTENSSRAAMFRRIAAANAAISGNFHEVRNYLDATSVSYSGTARAGKFQASIRFPQHAGDIAMVITAAHIQPIVALIAGVLILIMPRLLNFIVAIYLILTGLAGLGVFKMFHI
jgi:hypothetical protein